jgi:polyphosphate kinase
VEIYQNNGEREVFISSADWMTRNIDHRVEVGCRISDPKLQRRICDILDLQWSDTTKARIVDKELLNRHRRRGNRRKIRSQEAIYEYLKAAERTKPIE